jgi:hypothetical protein
LGAAVREGVKGVARFKGRDQRLPLLTQIYQLEGEDEHRELFHTGAMADALKGLKEGPTGDLFVDRAVKQYPDEFAAFLRLCDLARRIMDDQARHGGVTARNLEELRGWRSHLFGAYKAADVRDYVKDRRERILCPDEVNYSVSADEYAFAPILMEEIARHLNEGVFLWKRGQPTYAVCIECNSVFVLYRKKKGEYCSYRCSQRAGQRRRTRLKLDSSRLDKTNSDVPR